MTLFSFWEKEMNRNLTLLCIFLLMAGGLTSGCRPEGEPKAVEVNFEQLFSSPAKYDGKEVMLEGFYFDGFEVQVIAEELEYSGYVEGHLVPGGRYLWIEGGIPAQIYNQLYRQSMMGPEERYGKVRIEGKFEYGGKYGHGGGYNSQIIPLAVELLSWSPPLQ